MTTRPRRNYWPPDRRYHRYIYITLVGFSCLNQTGIWSLPTAIPGPSVVEANDVAAYFQQQNYTESSHHQFSDGPNQSFECWRILQTPHLKIVTIPRHWLLTIFKNWHPFSRLVPNLQRRRCHRYHQGQSQYEP